MSGDRKNKILIVDDIEQNRLILSEILKDKYTIVEADDGDTCLEKLHEDDEIVLVLLDIMMPRLNGFEVLKHMSKDSKLKNKAVIITTGATEEGLESKTLREGAVNFIKKPYRSDEVRFMVDNIVTRIVTEKEILTRELDGANERLSAILNLIPDGIAMIDYYKDHQIDLMYFNQYLANFFRINYVIQKDEIYRFQNIDKLIEFIHPHDRNRVKKKVLKCINEGTSITSQFRVVVLNDIKWIRMSVITFKRDDGSCRCHVLISDISVEKEREERIASALEQIRYVTNHDKLTKVYNRDMFYFEATKLIQKKPTVKFAIVMWDIKNFKIVNELFGRDMGDQILILIANKLRDVVGDSGVYGRLQADKFVVCIPVDKFDVHFIINKIDFAINEARIVDYNLKIFCGVYNITEEEDIPVDQMCDRANMALKSAKRDYVNRFSYYDSEMRQAVLEEQIILNEMEDALKSGQFKVCYQPIFSLTTGKPVSAEALVRWIHPENGIISPLKFISIFENNKFITKLDWYVLEEVCKFQRRRQLSGAEMIPVSVNFSRLDCYVPMICENVLALVKAYGITPDLIKIEITESAYTMDKEQIVSVTKKFRNYGFNVLMDDFGSAYSSLNTLKDVDVDVLKIDKSFIDDIEDSDRAGAIVSNVVRMARTIGIDIIAEGVETQYQIDFLRGIGCDTIQGYYYSKPLFEKDFNHVVEKYNGVPVDKRVENFRANSINIDNLWGGNKGVDALFGGLIGALGLYELNPKGVLEIIRVNDAYYDLFGASPKTVYSDLGLSFSRLVDESKSDLLNACSRAKYRNEIVSAEIRKYHEDGHLMWISCRVKHIGRSDDRDFFYILINDITEQKRLSVTKQFSVYADMFKSFFNNVFEYNLTSKKVNVLYADGKLGFEMGMSFTYDKFIKECEEIFVKTSDVKSFHEKGFEYLDDNMVMVDTVKLCRVDGVEAWYEIRLLKISNSDDDIFISCLVDITDDKKLAFTRECEIIGENSNNENILSILDKFGLNVFRVDLETEHVEASELTSARWNDEFGDIYDTVLIRNIIYPGDVGDFDNFINNLKDKNDDSSIYIRMFSKSGFMKWIKLENISSQSDIKRDNTAIIASQIVDDVYFEGGGPGVEKEQIADMLSFVNFGVGIFEYGSEIKIRYLNNYFKERFNIGDDFTVAPVKQFLSYLSNVCERHSNEDGNSKLTFSDEHMFTDTNGTRHFVTLIVTIVKISNNKSFVYCVVENLSETENKFQIDEDGLVNSILVESSDYIVLDYITKTKDLKISLPSHDRGRKIIRYKNLKTVKHQKWIRPEYQDTIERKLFRKKIADGAKTDYLEFLANVDGFDYRWHLAEFHYVSDERGKVVRVIGRISDIQTKKEREIALCEALCERESLIAKAEIDSVTGVYNRATVEKYIERKLAGSNSESVFILYEIDNYFENRDVIGNIKTETFLNRVAKVFNEEFRHGDIIGLIDAGIFVTFLPDIKTKQGAYFKIKETVSQIAQIAKEIGIEHEKIMNIGVSFSPDDGIDFKTLYNKSNIALFSSRKSKKNAYSIFREPKSSVAELD